MSMNISGMASGAAQIHEAHGVKALPQVQQPETEIPVRSRPPAVDEYIPEEKQEPSGRYWLGKDEDGQPKVYFDDLKQAANPGRAADKPSAPPASAGKGDKSERCTANTDQVDREIERLKKRKETLEQQINAQTDEVKIKELERKLTQVERELAQKDNDTYRRQHTKFS